MVQDSGTGTSTTGLSKALQQSLQAVNGIRTPLVALVFTIEKMFVWCSNTPEQRKLLAHFLQVMDMAFIPWSSFIQPNGLRDKQQKTSWNDDDLIAQVLGLPTSEVPSAETLRGAYRDLAEGCFLGSGGGCSMEGMEVTVRWYSSDPKFACKFVVLLIDANCICSDHATPKGSYIVLLVPCFTNLEVF